MFEIVDPSRLRIEALAFDPALAANIGGATLAVGDQRVPLTFVGAARSLREQALPLGFRAQGAALAQLAVGQPVRVFVQTKRQGQGHRGAGRVADEEPGQPDHRLGQDGAGTLRAAHA